MTRQPVKSSNISAVGHSPATQILEVEFSNGGIYQYDGVSEQTYKDMLSSESVGSYFHKNIRANIKGRKMEPETP